MSSKPHDDSGNGGENRTDETEIEDRVDAQELLELYLSDKRPEMNGATARSHKSRLSFFVDWFQQTDYEYVDELDRTDILRFKQWRFTDHAKITISTQLDTLRQLLKWSERNGLVVEDIHVAAESPDTDDDDDISDRYVQPQDVQDALGYLKQYEWGQRQTVVLALIWETAMRRSAVRALDVDDWNRPDGDGKGYLTIRNRPETGTRLKNGGKSERDVAVRAEIADIIDAWIDGPRPVVTDDHGRSPLITTQNGRISEGCIQTDVYDALKPQKIGRECSCNPVEGTCYANGKSDAYACEDSEGPHAVRKAAITYHLDNGWPIELISDRANCGAKTINKHYDKADDHQQMKRREEFLDNL
jgi:integrase